MAVSDYEEVDWAKNLPEDVLDALEVVVDLAQKYLRHLGGMPVTEAEAVNRVRRAVEAEKEEREWNAG
jgi:hypothetical protein